MLLTKPGVSGRSLPPAFTVRLMSWLGRDGLTVSRAKATVSAPPASVMVTTNAGCSVLRGLLQLGGGLARSPASGGTAVVAAGVAIPIAVVCRGRVPAVVPDQPARKLAVYILVRACCQIGDLAIRWRCQQRRPQGVSCLMTAATPTPAHRRHDTSDRAWDTIAPHLSGVPGKVGRPAGNNRRFMGQ